MKARHYAADAQAALRIEFHWDERYKRWIMTTTRPAATGRGRAQVEYYPIQTAAAMDGSAEQLLAFVIKREAESWLF